MESGDSPKSPGRLARSLLRVSTAGSVDDGKSTFIGRILYDCKGLYDDQMAAIAFDSDGELNLAHLTDGLKAEREQGITIDVAYRYFSTPKRHFILADTPGHEQYTRNMATGASTANVAILLIDARKGVVIQTKRHAFISSLLGVPRMLVAVNKMDLVGWSAEVYDKIVAEMEEFAAKLSITELKFVPVSALRGDNIVEHSKNMPWFKGEPVIRYLEDVYVDSDRNLVDFRFPVQLVVRPNQKFRGYAGQIVSGAVSVGDEVMVLPTEKRAIVESLFVGTKEFKSTVAPQSIVMTLSKEIDISRGDMLVRPGNFPKPRTEFEAIVIWMSEDRLDSGRRFLLKHTTKECRGTVDRIVHQIDVETLSRRPAEELRLNDIGRIAISTNIPLAIDPYAKNRSTGSFILIDESTHATVAAGMMIDQLPEERLKVLAQGQSDFVPKSQNLSVQEGHVNRLDIEARQKHRSATLWFTGLSGSGKTSVAIELEKRLFDSGVNVFRLDGDLVRTGINSNLGFSTTDRLENVRRISEVAKIMNQAGVVVLVSLISPLQEMRSLARRIVGDRDFHEIYMNTPLAECERRDLKGLYKKARAGEIKDFTGISAPFDEPTDSELTFADLGKNPKSIADEIMTYLSSVIFP